MTLCAVFLLIASTSRALPGITMKSYFELYVIVFSICAFIVLSAEKEAWWILGSGLAVFRRM